MYSGTRQDLVPAMERLSGRACPPQYNPADFAIHVIADIPEDQLMEKVQKRVIVLFDSNIFVLQSFDQDKVVRVSAVSDFDPVVVMREDQDVEMGLVEEKEIVASVEESEKLGM